MVQTQNYNFRIQQHLVNNAEDYVYVTPAGNYTFSRVSPFAMSLVWLNGNVSMSLASFGVIQGGTLAHGTSIVTASNSLYNVNTTEGKDGQVRGYLSVSYNFTSTPFKATAMYTSVSKIGFQMEWLVVGGDYVTGSNDTVANQLSGVNTNKTLGNLPYVTLKHSNSQSNFVINVDVSDAGLANFVYGQLHFDNQSYTAIAAVFSQNVTRIDPTLEQQPALTCAPVTSCTQSFSSAPATGDVIIVGLDCNVAPPSWHRPVEHI